MADQLPAASSAAHALPAAVRARDIELPVDVLVLVLLPLRGDTVSLCAAACVSRAWREAASLPRLWKKIGRFWGNAGANLTDARLKQLVSRSRRRLQHLDLRGSGVGKSSLTDGGLAKALRREKRIQSFAANGSPLTGAGIAAALAPSRGRLRDLRLCGVRPLPKFASAGMSSIQQEAFMVTCRETIDELRALLAPGGLMTAEDVCDVMQGDVICTRMCNDEHSCICGASFCTRHADCVYACGECGDPVCILRLLLECRRHLR